MTSRMLARANLDFKALATDLEYLLTLPKDFEAYDEFSSGDYRNHSLWNGSGIAHDSRYRGTTDPPARTVHGAATPVLEATLRAIFNWDRVAMVRARNLRNATLFPHRDYLEMGKPCGNYFRAFLALETAPLAFHSDASGVFQMQPGELWFLDAASVHAAANLTSSSRLHICVDLVFDGQVDEEEVFSPNAQLDEPVEATYATRPPLPAGFERDLERMGPLLRPGTLKDLLALLTRMHFLFESAPQDVWSWLEIVSAASTSTEVKRKVAALREHMLDLRGFEQEMDLGQWDPQSFDIELARP